MPLRKRKNQEIGLDKILDGYQATTAPASGPTSAVATVRCWSCNRPNIYDARRSPPRRCTWCNTVL